MKILKNFNQYGRNGRLFENLAAAEETQAMAQPMTDIEMGEEETYTNGQPTIMLKLADKLGTTYTNGVLKGYENVSFASENNTVTAPAGQYETDGKNLDQVADQIVSDLKSGKVRPQAQAQRRPQAQSQMRSQAQAQQVSERRTFRRK